MSEYEGKGELEPELDWIKSAEELIKSGFIPRKKGEYIVFTKGKISRSLGKYTDEKWNYISKMYEAFKSKREEESELSKLGYKISVIPPKSISRSVELTIKTIFFYEWARSKGYSGSLSDFINESVENLFKKYYGIEPVMLIRTEEEEGEEVKEVEGE